MTALDWCGVLVFGLMGGLAIVAGAQSLVRLVKTTPWGERLYRLGNVAIWGAMGFIGFSLMVRVLRAAGHGLEWLQRGLPVPWVRLTIYPGLLVAACGIIALVKRSKAGRKHNDRPGL